MPAFNPTYLCKNPAKVYVTKMWNYTLPAEPLADNSNIAALIADIETNLDYTRTGSIRSAKLRENPNLNKVEIKADECDTGVVCTFCERTAWVDFNRLECKNVDVLWDLLSAPVFEDTANNAFYQGYKFDTYECPRLSIKIETCADENGNVDVFYLLDVGLEAEFISEFVNLVNAGDLAGTDMVFNGNQGWYILKCRTTVDPSQSIS